jgi:hypothetical protein
VKWLLILAVMACEKPDSVATLRAEAVALEAYYRPILDDLVRRTERIRIRGEVLRDPVPGADVNGMLFKTAGQTIGELHTMIFPAGKSALDKHLETTTDADELAKLVAETRTRLESGTASINDKLNAVETWVAQAEIEVKLSSTNHGPADQAATSP